MQRSGLGYEFGSLEWTSEEWIDEIRGTFVRLFQAWIVGSWAESVDLLERCVLLWYHLHYHRWVTILREKIGIFYSCEKYRVERLNFDFLLSMFLDIDIFFFFFLIFKCLKKFLDKIQIFRSIFYWTLKLLFISIMYILFKSNSILYWNLYIQFIKILIITSWKNWNISNLYYYSCISISFIIIFKFWF